LRGTGLLNASGRWLDGRGWDGATVIQYELLTLILLQLSLTLRFFTEVSLKSHSRSNKVTYVV
jgi:hypothetical protein